MDENKHEKLRELFLGVAALLESMDSSVRSDQENIFKYAGYKQYIRKYNHFVSAISQEIQIAAIVDLYDIDKIPGSMDTTIVQQKEFFESVYTNVSILKAYLENRIGLKKDERTNLRDFFQANLRKAIFTQPEKELEVQDAIERLLIGRGYTKGVDYDRETGRVKVSIKEVVPDFIFPRLGLAIEVKLSKEKAKSRSLVDEINADIMAYSKKYSLILFIVYDLSTIRDEIEFKHDLEIADSVQVIIVKH